VSVQLTKSTEKIGVGLIGCGTVGTGVVRLLQEQAEYYAKRLGRRLELRRVLVRDPSKPRCNGMVDRALLTDDFESFIETPDMLIVVEAAGGRGLVSGYVRGALDAAKHVVTANKSLLAAEGAELFALARKRNVAIAFEASCAGGIPIITALLFGLAANRIEGLYGILNGTCNYILTEMTQRRKTYADALAEAQDEGFAEADPALDVSGCDAAEKLSILASLAFGAAVETATVACEGIDRLDLSDIQFGAELGYEIKLLAIAERSQDQSRSPATTQQAKLSLRVHPCFIRGDLPLAQVHGPFNALAVYGHALGHSMYVGRGAGQMPTASAVVADLLNVASGWYPRAFSEMNVWLDQQPPAVLSDPDDLTSRFYLRISARDVPGVVAKVSAILGQEGISMGALLQHEVAAGQFVPVVIVTHEARQGAVTRAMKKIENLDVVDGSPVCLRIVDLPAG